MAHVAHVRRQLLADQGGRCAICGRELLDEDAHLDHCHRTGEVRGVLCRACNHGLGNFGDSVPTLRRAIKYLAKSNERIEIHTPLHSRAYEMASAIRSQRQEAATKARQEAGRAVAVRNGHRLDYVDMVQAYAESMRRSEIEG